MKILITGGSGLLGKYLLNTAPSDCTIYWTWATNSGALQPGESIYERSIQSYRMNVRDKWQVNNVIDRIAPDVIIHCAAMGSVDYAEDNYQEVRQVNVLGVEKVINAAKLHNSKFVYISSNAVYAGDNHPYSENDRTDPINAYGLLKKKAEQLVMQSNLDFVIIRPFMLFGWPFSGGRTNWAKSIVESLEMGQTVNLVNDTFWQPTYAASCAAAVWDLGLSEVNEIFNVASSEKMTLYEFGCKIAAVWDLDIQFLNSVSSDYFTSISKRPVDTTYDLTKLTDRYGVLPTVKDGLRSMKNEL